MKEVLNPHAEIKFLNLVYKERQAQDEKWGDQSLKSNATWGLILGEEYGEICREILDSDVAGCPAAHTWGNMGRKRLMNLKNELVQLAAVACAFHEALDIHLG